MKIDNVVALVTGANGGVGTALVDEFLRRGAAKVYIAGRSEAALTPLTSRDDKRLIPVIIDVTQTAQIESAAKSLTDVTLLVNNAGYTAIRGVLAADAIAEAQQEMNVNYFGPLRMARAFAPGIHAAGGGTIVNVLSFLSLVTLPLMGTYSASKAAALSMSRSLRAELATQGIQVVHAMPVQVDTAMGAWYEGPKIPPAEAAHDILDAVEANVSEVFPGKLSEEMNSTYKSDPVALQAYLDTLLPGAEAGESRFK